MFGKDAEDTFAEIPEGIAARAVLKQEDLVLMHRVFM